MQIHLLIVCGMCIYILPLPSFKFEENVWKKGLSESLIYSHVSYFLKICVHSCLGLLIFTCSICVVIRGVWATR